MKFLSNLLLSWHLVFIHDLLDGSALGADKTWVNSAVNVYILADVRFQFRYHSHNVFLGSLSIFLISHDFNFVLRKHIDEYKGIQLKIVRNYSHPTEESSLR